MLEFKQAFIPFEAFNEYKEDVFQKVLKERENRTSGYYELPFEKKALQAAQHYIRTHKTLIQKLKHLVIIGIGGSSLGLKAIDGMLSSLPQRNSIKLRFLECTDSIEVERTLKKVKLKTSLFIVISKSGTTIETSSLMKYVLERYNGLHTKYRQHFLAITDVDSPLQAWCQKQKITYINIDKDVGGRFSVFSSVGVVPLMILGYDVKKILKGARDLATRFFERKEEHILDKALYFAQHRTQYPINVLFSYSSIFKDFNAWYVQLWAESLGKINTENEHIGLTPISLLGSIDQHSFLQLIVQGCKDKSVTFIALNPKYYPKPHIPKMKLEFLESTNFVNGVSFATLLHKQQIATMQTLESQNIPTDSIMIHRLCEQSIGALIMYYEILTSCVGCAFNINTYDQPGVEFGKIRLRDMFLGH